MSQKLASMDPRVRQTRWQLQDALRELVAEKGYRAVSVQDIAARANVNRTTFYLHFRSKAELLDLIAEDLVQRAARLAGTEPPERRPDAATPRILVAFFLEVEASAEFYERMVAAEGNLAFLSLLTRFVEQESLWRLERGVSIVAPEDVPLPLAARLVASTVVGTLSWWLEQGRPHGAHAVADWVWRMLAPRT
jgi:AcrR family transcriptional regulator